MSYPPKSSQPASPPNDLPIVALVDGAASFTDAASNAGIAGAGCPNEPNAVMIITPTTPIARVIFRLSSSIFDDLFDDLGDETARGSDGFSSNLRSEQ
jgi:hypothetical protein